MVIVNPGGTGSPALVISARPAPLPPSSERIEALPSALPAPNRYIHFFFEAGVGRATGAWVTVAMADAEQEELPKIQVKFLYPVDLSATVRTLIKVDKQVAGLGLAPVLDPGKRYFVKNKTLFPLMKDQQVVFFTLLEGEVIRGIIADFSRYDITVNLKGGTPVVILRHSIYDARDKTGRCLLKAFQDAYKDWQKSPLFVPA